MEPRPRLVLMVAALPSERLLATLNQVEEARAEIVGVPVAEVMVISVPAVNVCTPLLVIVELPLTVETPI